MSDQPNFGSLLDVPADQVKRPAPLPKGTYLLLCSKFEPVVSSQKKTPGIRYIFNVLQAHSDVDQTQLAEIENLTKRVVRYDFWVTEDALFMLTEFHKTILGEQNTVGYTVKQNIPRAVGQQVFGFIDQVPSDKPGSTDVYSNITTFAPVS